MGVTCYVEGCRPYLFTPPHLHAPPPVHTRTHTHTGTHLLHRIHCLCDLFSLCFPTHARTHTRTQADGHCMYRAVEDQLGQAGGAASAPDHLALRKLAAAHIRAHADDFLPFIFDEDEKGEPAEQLEAYCEVGGWHGDTSMHGWEAVQVDRAWRVGTSSDGSGH